MTNPKSGSDIILRVTPDQLSRCFPRMRRQEKFLLMGGGAYLLLSILLVAWIVTNISSTGIVGLRTLFWIPIFLTATLCFLKLALKRTFWWWAIGCFVLMMLSSSALSLYYGFQIFANA